MKFRSILLIALVLCLLSGCRKTTTVILPPETQGTTTTPTTQPSSLPTTVPTTEPTVESPTEPSTEPATEPATAPPTEPATALPTEPPTEPTTQSPTEPPTTEPTTEPPTEPPVESTEDLSYAILTEINSQRAIHGLPTFAFDDALADSAALRAWECSILWSAIRPDGSNYDTVFSGSSWSATGEIRLYGTPDYTAGQMVDVWMNSPSHREQILSQNYTHCAVGICRTENYIYIVALFAG